MAWHLAEAKARLVEESKPPTVETPLMKKHRFFWSRTYVHALPQQVVSKSKKRNYARRYSVKQSGADSHENGLER